LAEGRGKRGTFQTRDLTVNYEYSRTGGQLLISGAIQFASSLQMGFSLVRGFHLGLLIMNAQGNILSNQGLMTISRRDPEKVSTFSTSMSLPPQASSMAFHYTGKATEGLPSRDGGVETEFWHYPR
jgi:hypothetical protein